ncbi:hypothetical protein N7499_008597 [Penicillium canescens]|uniref:C2H2-type domain-containing protein n=1 Tax=Penicillium canescens TaxID=5083 RepID=A0AAD6N2E2_PENCN|nr:uncharacterized protein N7446_013632 [Penicillium canescens]KAJ5985125.1 hypothetical protein N7522_012321 [Penicillium canescens]KAJ6023273.1 hypothetical protein N7460_013668 [Penicillium canescens]KAJ6025457.1 hypothetical protein N7444_013136 [Penicillium canescens]KAJ6042566.1 hypothetical protein N7446_013632 [Penicillium canescens]KAJ6076616.1 hypothetical protein N7499_008597 [Penicillium canescens]
METAEPVSYEFPGHAVGAFAHRRPMDLTLSQNIPFYSHPTTASYSFPYQAPNGLPYNYGHPVGHAHSNPYQHYFVPSQHHPVQHQPLRLTTEPQPLQSLPQIRPAKNAISQPAKSPTDHDSGMQTTGAGHSSPDGAHETKPSPSDIAFSTNVDVLMKAIQAKHSSSPHQHSLPPLQHLAPASQVYPMTTYPVASPTPPRYYLGSEGQLSRSGKKRKYTCTLSGCGKSFAQKTHLDIHIRAHTGDKPFICKEPSCGQRFSQQGNLKTHQRRHTGEKPFQCEECGKSFAQRGNVRAHKLTHQRKKPFNCLLDECGKQFTQLGNLKSHQNKFHAATLRNLTLRFSQIGENGPVNPGDRELWEYFATLYKNSNKGIKGRGKDRRISMTRRSDGCGSMDRIASVESEEGSSKMMRRESFEDNMSAYNSSSSDGGDADQYYMDRRVHYP